jgi:hypothetical protein
MTKSIKKIIYGDIFWFKEGTDILHREDGPACEHADGSKAYYLNGKRHRENGPAIEYDSGYKDYYYHGKRINCSTDKEFKQLIKMKAFW